MNHCNNFQIDLNRNLIIELFRSRYLHSSILALAAFFVARSYYLGTDYMNVISPMLSEIQTLKAAVVWICFIDIYRLSDFLSWFCAFYQYGSVSGVKDAHPLFEVFFLRRIVWHVVMIQCGFLWYYSEHRELVTPDTVRFACKSFHVSMSVVQIVSSGFVLQPFCILPWSLGWLHVPYGVSVYFAFMFFMSRYVPYKLAKVAAAKAE